MQDAIDLGIDFGTTRTVVAVCDRGNYPVLGFVGPDGASIEWYPSVVAELDGVLSFGLDALAVAAEEERATLVRSFKRLLSEKEISPSSMVKIGSVELELVDLVARFLSALRRDILERSNLPVKAKKGAAMRCVVAVPANAHSTQRFITLEAFRRAGFDVVALLNEPSAAGVEYAHRYRNTITSRREHILVYDLGGGTFDASLVRMSGKHHDVVASHGLAKLGGDDFDDALLALAAPSLTGRARGLALDACRDAKERINPNSKRIAVELESGVAQVPVDAYYERCAPLVRETIAMMKRVLARSGDDVEPAGIYVVGGASALPVITRMLRDEYGRRVHRSAYPSAATAIGLAISSSYEITERFSHHFGVFREAKGGAEVAFDPIFDEAIVQPTAAQGEAFEQVRQYRAVHNVGHFRYIECGWLDEGGVPSGDITPFADVLFPFDPALRAPDVDLRAVPVERTGAHGPLVEERYLVHAGGILELTIRDLETGFERRHRFA